VTVLAAAGILTAASLSSGGPASAAKDPTAFNPGPQPCLTYPWSRVNKDKVEHEFQVPSGELRFGDHLYRLQRRFTQPVANSIPTLWMDSCENMPVQQVEVGNKLTTLFLVDGEVAQFRDSTVIHKTGQPWHEIRGAINAKYYSLGGPLLGVGFPETNEIATPKKIGAFNHFDKDFSIYWSPSTGAHKVGGAIRAAWSSLGWENSPVGFPTTDEFAAGDGFGRGQHFEHGSVYWSTKTGAHAVYGAIFDAWRNLGWENGHIGFPTSDETADPEVPGGRIQHFAPISTIKSWGSSSATSDTVTAIKWNPRDGATAITTVIPRY